MILLAKGGLWFRQKPHLDIADDVLGVAKAPVALSLDGVSVVVRHTHQRRAEDVPAHDSRGALTSGSIRHGEHLQTHSMIVIVMMMLVRAVSGLLRKFTGGGGIVCP